MQILPCKVKPFLVLKIKLNLLWLALHDLSASTSRASVPALLFTLQQGCPRTGKWADTIFIPYSRAILCLEVPHLPLMCQGYPSSYPPFILQSHSSGFDLDLKSPETLTGIPGRRMYSLLYAPFWVSAHFYDVPPAQCLAHCNTHETFIE